MTWVHEGAYVIFFLSQEEGQYDVDILLKDLLYKDIQLTLYVRTNNVMARRVCSYFGITMAPMSNIFHVRSKESLS